MKLWEPYKKEGEISLYNVIHSPKCIANENEKLHVIRIELNWIISLLTQFAELSNEYPLKQGKIFCTFWTIYFVFRALYKEFLGFFPCDPFLWAITHMKGSTSKWEVMIQMIPWREFIDPWYLDSFFLECKCWSLVMYDHISVAFFCVLWK